MEKIPYYKRREMELESNQKKLEEEIRAEEQKEEASLAYELFTEK